MRINIKNLFIFSTIYSGIYVFLINQFANLSIVQNNANFNFINLSTDIFNIEGMYGGANSYYFNIFGNVLNFTFLLYIITYATLPFYCLLLYLRLKFHIMKGLKE